LTAEVEKMQENIQNAIQQALEESPERKFVESIEMAFTLRDVDLKNPTNRIQEGGSPAYW